MHITLRPGSSFNLETSLRALDERVGTQRRLGSSIGFHTSFEVTGGAVDVAISQKRPGGEVTLTFSEGVGEEERQHVASLVRHIFALNVDPAPFFELGEKDEALQRVLSCCPGLRPVRFSTPFEGLVAQIIGGEYGTERRTEILVNLREVCGVIPSSNPQAPPAFPGKLTLLACPVRLLEIAGLKPRLARRLHEAAASLLGDPDVLEHVRSIPSQAHAVRHLVAIPGINLSGALDLLDHTYGWPDLLRGSKALVRAVRRFYGPGDGDVAERIDELSRRYVGWRSWWGNILLLADRISVGA